MDESETYTIDQTKQRLGVSRQTVYAMIARGQLTKYIKPYGNGQGVRRVLFSRKEVDDLATAVIPAPLPISPPTAKPKKPRKRA